MESEVVHSGTIGITYSIIEYKGYQENGDSAFDVLSEHFQSDEWFDSKEEAIDWIERHAG